MPYWVIQRIKIGAGWQPHILRAERKILLRTILSEVLGVTWSPILLKYYVWFWKVLCFDPYNNFYLSFWPAHDRARRCDIILQGARSLAASSHPCRNPNSERSRFTWSSHRVRCTLLRLVLNCGSLSNTFLVGGGGQPSVSHTAQQARGSSFSSKLHARTHRQRWSGGYVAETRPERLRSDGPELVSVELPRANQCAIYLTYCCVTIKWRFNEGKLFWYRFVFSHHRTFR